MKKEILIILFGMLIFTCTQDLLAQTSYYVSPNGSGTACTQGNPCSLSSVLSKAAAGDAVILLNGTYTGTFTLAKSGTASQPITIRAQNARQAKFDKTSFNLDGNYAVLTAFIFERSQVTMRGNRNSVSHSIFRISSGGPSDMESAVRTLDGASYNRIHHNELTNWNSTYGFRIRHPNAQTTGNRIDHNYIHDITSTSSTNSPEVIQVGANHSDSFMKTGTCVEYNLIENAKLIGELISIKSSNATIRGNTFKSSNGTINVRHGTYNTFINNTLIDMTKYTNASRGEMGVRGDNHQMIGNRLVNTNMTVPSGDATQDNITAGVHPSARYTLVAGNIMENGGKIYIGQGSCCEGDKPAMNTKVEGNQGTVVTQGGNHTGTQIAPTYNGNPGKAVLMTPSQVGPGAPDPGPGCGNNGGTTGINNEQSSDEIRAYPNPTSGKLTIEVGDKYSELIVRNVLGEEILREKSESEKLKLDLSYLPRGIYFLEVMVGELRFIRKIVKQ